MNIGCIALVPWEHGGFVGIDCAKGRGLILPGGKFDKNLDRRYEDTASRELQEETGVLCLPSNMQYLFQGPSITDDFWVIAFLANGAHGELKAGSEGRPQRVVKAQLLGSRFVAYYSLLFNALRDVNLHSKVVPYYAGS